MKKRPAQRGAHSNRRARPMKRASFRENKNTFLSISNAIRGSWKADEEEEEEKKKKQRNNGIELARALFPITKIFAKSSLLFARAMFSADWRREKEPRICIRTYTYTDIHERSIKSEGRSRVF